MAVSYVLDYMKRNGVPLTRENYLEIAYLGNPPEELSAEQEAELPPRVPEQWGRRDRSKHQQEGRKQARA